MSRAPYQPRGRELERRAEIAEHGRRRTDKPQPGFFAIRLRKGAVEVGAAIWWGPLADPETGEALDRSWYWGATINGEPDPSPLPTPSDRVWSVWLYGRRIAREDYEFLVADRRWAAEHAPELPEANPTAKVNLKTLPLPF